MNRAHSSLVIKRQTDLADYLYPADVSIRTVLERFNTAPRQFGMVVEENLTLIGTVTDGDIRRGLLKGVGLDEPVSLCANRDPVTVRQDAALPDIAKKYQFIPELGGGDRVTAMFVLDDVSVDGSSCLIMAGGFGSRLGEQTRDCPKPLLPLDDKPILEHVLRGVEKTNPSQVFVTTHYLAAQIDDFVADRHNASDTRTIRESEGLGTAGGISLLPESIKTPLLVVNGDVVTKTDFQAMLDFHTEQDFDATIAVAWYEHKIPYGVVDHSKTGIFTALKEKPTYRYFVSAGIYCLNRSVINLVPPNKRLDMPELLNEAREIGLRVGVFPIHEYWKDVGLPLDLKEARSDASELGS